jgi:hypothetical protein
MFSLVLPIMVEIWVGSRVSFTCLMAT